MGVIFAGVRAWVGEGSHPAVGWLLGNSDCRTSFVSPDLLQNSVSDDFVAFVIVASGPS